MPVNADPLELHMLSLINEERESRGLNPLALETNLNMSAEEHSQWMLDTNVFSHTGAGGSSATDRIEAELDLTGSWRTAENIAIQSIRGEPGLLDDVENLHESLMNSPGHRVNILNPDLEYIGLGIELGDFTYSSGGTFQSLIATQNFATTAAEVDVDPGTGASPLEMPDPVPVPDPEVSDPDPEPQMPDDPENVPVAEAPDPAPTEPENTDEEEGETPVAEAPTPEPEPAEPEGPANEDEETPVAEAPDPTPTEPDAMDEDEEDDTPVAEAPDPAPTEPDVEDTPDEDVYACPLFDDDFDSAPLRNTARFEFADDVFEFRDAETVFGNVSMGDFISRLLIQASELAERQNQEIETFEFAFSFDLRPNDPASGQLPGRESLNEFDVDFAAFEAPVEQSIDFFS
ncbi:CAP domain-containing protein [Roseovarius phycicola]|uniref:CAP domain-containing protein n=1 Tax=Roseovarius phycicola TaxID=3080976 RepID=A0ABZ2HIQ8_9RHOB